MCWCHQIDISRSFILQPQKNFCQFLYRKDFPIPFLCDLTILAKYTFQRTARKKYRTRSAAAGQTRLLPKMKRRARRLFTPPPRWGALTPVQRVRAVYQHLLEQQKRIAPNAVTLTPEELCARADRDAAFARLYDRARYSDNEITAQEAETYRPYLKN